MDINQKWREHNFEEGNKIYSFYVLSVNLICFFMSFILMALVICRYVNKSMSKRKSFNEVLAIMQSGEAHINFYKKFDPEALKKHQEDMKKHKEETEEKRGLLKAHALENEDIEESFEQESIVSFYYEDEEGHVQKKMVKRKDLNKDDSDLD